MQLTQALMPCNVLVPAVSVVSDVFARLFGRPETRRLGVGETTTAIAEGIAEIFAGRQEIEVIKSYSHNEGEVFVCLRDDPRVGVMSGMGTFNLLLTVEVRSSSCVVVPEQQSARVCASVGEAVSMSSSVIKEAL